MNSNLLERVLLILAFVLTLFSCRKDKDIEVIQSESFIKFYGTEFSDSGVDLKVMPDGGFVVVGNKTINDKGDSVIYVVKTDKFGNEEWNYNSGTNGLKGICRSSFISRSGEIIVTGKTSNKIVVIKLNSIGDFLQSKIVSSDTCDLDGFRGIETPDGGYFFVGSYKSLTINENFFIIKTTSNLNEVKDKVWMTKDIYEGSAKDIIFRSTNNSFFVVGNKMRSNSDSKNSNIFTLTEEENSLIMSFNSWSTDISNVGAERIVELSNSDFLVIGNRIEGESFSFYIMRFNVIKDDNEYDVLVEKFNNEYASLGNFEGKSVCEISSGGFVVVGSTKSSGNGGWDQKVIKFDINGNVLWEKTYGGTGDDFATGVVETSDKGFAIVGSTEFEGNSTITLIKTNSEGIVNSK